MRNRFFSSARFRLAAALSLLLLLSAAVMDLHLGRFDWFVAASALLGIFISWMLVRLMFAPLSRTIKELETRLNAMSVGEYSQ